MGPAARLGVPFRNLDYAQFSSRDGAALVQAEPELLLGNISRHDLHPDLMSAEDLRVRELLDSGHLRVREGVVVRDVQTREVLSFVSPGLPHVVPQGLPSRAEDDMGR